MKWSINDGGIITPKIKTLRKWAKTNGHEEVDFNINDSVMKFHNDRPLGTVTLNYYRLSDAWQYLPSQKILDNVQLFDVFKQAINENDKSVRKIGVDILFSLSGDIYFDIQNFFYIYFLKKDDLFSDNCNYFSMLVYDTSNQYTHDRAGCFVVPELISYIYYNKIINPPLFTDFANWACQEFAIDKQIKINIDLSLRNK